MAITLTAIPGAPGFQLDAPAAASLGHAIAAGCPVDITNSYRSPEWQQQLYDGWVRRLPGYNFALPPSQSNHCKGIAVDTAGAMLTWLRTWGLPYGWVPDRNEAWHFDYVASSDQFAVAPVVAPVVVTPPTPPAIPAPTPAPAPVVAPAPAVHEEDEMISTVLYGYTDVMGRRPSPSEVLARLQEFEGKNEADVVAWFLASQPEPGAVPIAFRALVGHDPSPQQVAEWQQQPTVQIMWNNIAGTPESKAFRGVK